MSLKAFHLFFISLSILLSFGSAYWGVQLFVDEHNALYCVVGAVFTVVAVGLILYEIHFYKKFKHMSTL